MQFDAELMFDDEAAITVSRPSTNIIDRGQAQPGRGRPLTIYVQARQQFAAVGAGTLRVWVETDSSPDFTSPVRLGGTDVIPKAEMPMGADLLQTTVPGDPKRYLRLWYEVQNGPFTAGKVTAGLVADGHSPRIYRTAAVVWA